MRNNLAFPVTEPILAVYDLNSNTRTFDFAYFLVGAECYARLNNHPSFHLIIIQHNPDVISMRNAEYVRANKDTQRWRFENIILPLISLCPACVGHSYLPMSESLRTQFVDRHVYPLGYDGHHIPGLDHANVCDLANQLDHFDGLCASPLAKTQIQRWKRHNKIENNVITITLRQYPHDPSRNSNLPEWIKFAHEIRMEGFEPVLVPDNYRLFDNDDGGGCFVCREAALHMDLRAALYEDAQLNFFIPNGPTALGLLNRNVNYVEMNLLVSESQDSNADALHTRGTRIGQRSYFTVPSGSYQVLSWLTDVHENIRHEFDLFRQSTGVLPHA